MRLIAHTSKQIGFLFVAFVFLFVASVTTFAASALQSDEQTYRAELKRAQDDLQAQRYNDAIRAFMRANQMKENHSDECYWGIAQAYQALGAPKKVIENCDLLLKYAQDDYSRAQAYNLKGTALAEWAEDRHESQKAAEVEFRRGLALNPRPPVHILHFNLAMVLLNEGQESEGLDELRNYLQLDPRGSEATEAKKILDNRARQPVYKAPSFTIRSMQGDRLSMRDLLGKVVMLDFWATWCGPCRASLPDLKRLYRRFQTDPRFMMLSISSDQNKSIWREFVRTHDMIWPQYHDDGFRLNREFNVTSIPTYIVIGADGSLRRRFSGWGPSQERLIEEELNRTLASTP